jgi:cytochrome c oxidase assembly protein subunit 15
MVASGLAERVSVSPYRLAFHLTLACLLYVALLWTAQRLRPRTPAAKAGLGGSAMGLVALVLVQIYLGALVAGLDAGLAYNTWPLIDDALVPDLSRLMLLTPAWRNFFENVLTVQFDHRMVAYALWLAAVLHAASVWRSQGAEPARNGALLLACAVTLQASLGILTLLYQVPLGLALAHQAMAMIVLTLATVHAERVTLPRPALRPRIS